MDLSLSEEQEQLVEAFRVFFAKECPAAVVRAAEAGGGFAPGLWDAVSALGGPTMGVAVDHGGAGAGMLDLELAAERAGAALAPVPLIDGWVTARLLASCGDAGRAVLARLADERPPVAVVALHPTRDGVARLVPGGAVATVVVGLDDDELVVVEGTPDAPARRHDLGSIAVADRTLRIGARIVLARGADAHARHERAVDEWRVLTAGALVGLAGAALEIGVEYAKQREQFGVPIGSFQALAHRLADVATAVDGAQLLAREAAWAADEVEPDAVALGRMAFLFATRAAQDTTAAALHVHGGYGFTLEYDIQLYLRRAKAWPLALGDPRRGALHLADALFGPVERAQAGA
ncbi:MAG TPA: acyl-CoA dehydrogenase family protein [Acidimicrobiia bacterium]|nr:acyl-CoA dehydrogenase family protein [Acidimicrobiia bacterium]